MVESQKLNSTAEITAISWTGGKDCNLALLQAYRETTLDVKYLLLFRFSSNKPFSAHPVPFMEKQAESLGLKLVFVDFPDDTKDYKKAYYVDGIKRMNNEYGIQVIVTGDMDLVGTMTTNWMKACCEEAGIRCHLPLWNINREESLNMMLNERFEIIFSCVKAPFFDGSWINRRLDRQALQEMKAIIDEGLTQEQIDDGTLPLDLCGERGEYHTMCVDGPLYKKRVVLDINAEPMEEVIEQGTNWKGNIHNAKCVWAISLKSS